MMQAMTDREWREAHAPETISRPGAAGTYSPAMPAFFDTYRPTAR